jgi:epidermal growth factor receptor kinase substrate 8
VIPLKLIDEPTSVINEDRNNTFNNIFLFTANYNLKNSEMHFFQCSSNDVSLLDSLLNFSNLKLDNYFKSIDIVDEIIATKEGRQFNRTSNQRSAYAPPVSSAGSTLVHPKEPAPVPQSDPNNNSSKYVPLGESIHEDVQMLNHCFDDIERFITKLQNKSIVDDDASAKNKNKKKINKKTKESVEKSLAAMTLTSYPLPEKLEDKHCIDILQKFKLSFNLLAKLKHHIHDPNSPELVHFLFTPLSIVVSSLNANNSKLYNAVWSPLILKEAKDLLLNCLTSKEYDLWQSLGDAWFICGDELTTQIHSEQYNPIFYDGWSPIISQTVPKPNKKTLSNYEGCVQQVQQKQKRIISKESQSDEQSVQVQDGASLENDEKFQEMKQWAFNLFQNGVK